MGYRVPIRLVKGAYDKYEKELARKRGHRSPVFDNKVSTDANYESLSEFLIVNKEYFRPVFATHNMKSMARVMALAERYGLEKSELEFQMLLGMGNEIKQAIVSMGYRMREYVPSGALARGLKYSGRRFAELSNKDNALTRTLKGDYSHLKDEPKFAEGDLPDDEGKAIASNKEDFYIIKEDTIGNALIIKIASMDTFGVDIKNTRNSNDFIKTVKKLKLRKSKSLVAINKADSSIAGYLLYEPTGNKAIYQQRIYVNNKDRGNGIFKLFQLYCINNFDLVTLHLQLDKPEETEGAIRKILKDLGFINKGPDYFIWKKPLPVSDAIDSLKLRFDL